MALICKEAQDCCFGISIRLPVLHDRHRCDSVTVGHLREAASVMPRGGSQLRYRVLTSLDIVVQKVLSTKSAKLFTGTFCRSNLRPVACRLSRTGRLIPQAFLQNSVRKSGKACGQLRMDSVLTAERSLHLPEKHT